MSSLSIAMGSPSVGEALGPGSSTTTTTATPRHLTTRQKFKSTPNHSVRGTWTPITMTWHADNFISGGVALSTAFAVTHPLDTLKTRMQATVGSGRPGLTLRSIFTRDLLRTLGRGFVTSVTAAAPQGGARLATYEFTKHNLLHPSSAAKQSFPSVCAAIQNPFFSSAFAAIVGDLASSVVKVPREVITSRLQVGQGSSASQVVAHILRTEGPRGLFRGFWSTTTRDCPFMVILFCSYEAMKAYHLGIYNYAPVQGGVLDLPTSISLQEGENDQDELTITTLKSTLFGGLSGSLAGFLTTPMDFVKTQIMTSDRKISISNVVKQTVAKHGVKTLFTGGIARSTWWFCVCSVFFPVYERCKESLREITEAEN